MFLYTVLAALVGVVAGIMIAARTKKGKRVVYGGLDKAGRVTNVLLTIVYVVASPFYLFLGMISEPDGEGVLWILGLLVSVIAASASVFCSLGLGFSVALRKKGRSGLSFALQFAGLVGIALTVLLYATFVGSLIRPLN